MYVCMYVCMYVRMYICVCMNIYKHSCDIYLLCMIKFKVRWCTCSVENDRSGLLLFCLLLFLLSILFLKPY